MPHIGPVGIVEILIILVVVLIIFGPKNLPKLGTAVGKAMKNLREGVGSAKKVAEKKVEEKAVEKKPATPEAAEAKTTETVVEEVEVIEKPKPTSEA